MPENVLKALNMVFEKNLAERQIENRTALAKLSYELQASEAEKQRNFEMLRTLEERKNEANERLQLEEGKLAAMNFTKQEINNLKKDGGFSEADSILGIAQNNVLNNAMSVKGLIQEYKGNIQSTNESITAMQELQAKLSGAAGNLAFETFEELAGSNMKMDVGEIEQAFDKIRKDERFAQFADNPAFKQQLYNVWDKRREAEEKFKSDASFRRYRDTGGRGGGRDYTVPEIISTYKSLYEEPIKSLEAEKRDLMGSNMPILHKKRISAIDKELKSIRPKAKKFLQDNLKGKVEISDEDVGELTGEKTDAPVRFEDIIRKAMANPKRQEAIKVLNDANEKVTEKRIKWIMENKL